jgi:23S rRNA pseudouridine2605 synthase
MRLNAFLAKAGVSSRRGADELIKAGKITVNGMPGQLNDMVGAENIVKLNGKQIEMRKSRYILLYKPAGYITTLTDEKNRRKVADLVRIPERIVPIGRLDYDTTGAIILTNNGDLVQKLNHPRFEVDKTYEAAVKGEITPDKLRKLAGGIQLEDGLAAPAKARKLEDNKIELIIHEGRKHQVRRMLAAVGLAVQHLHRSRYAGLDLTGLKPSQWRDLTDSEIKKLKG